MVKLNYTETLTYHEWEQIHNAIKEEKRQERRGLLKQKIYGGVLVLLSVLCPVLLGDCTASAFLFPLGVGAMVTKDRMI